MVDPRSEHDPATEPDLAQPDPAHPHLPHRRETWGDDPEEVDASQVVEEFAADVEVQREWHQHPAFAPFKVVWRFIRRSGKRIAVTIGGFAVLLAGVALLVLPGPGWLLIFIGLGILATEYVWAQRMLTYARQKAEQAKDTVLRKNKKKEPTDPPPPETAWPGGS
jgi:uncharacterized protein (TIGR02611 family)